MLGRRAVAGGSRFLYSSFTYSNRFITNYIPPLHNVPIEGLQYLKVSRTASQIYYLEPNNPPVNAIRSEMLGDFEKVAAEFIKLQPRAIVINCDVAGANIKEMKSQTPHKAEGYANRAKAAFNKLRQTGAPILGFTTKFAIGGGLELLMHADVRYCGPKAILQAPEIELDVFQSFGGTYLLPKFLGSGKALLAQLRNDVIDVHEAQKSGLITHLVHDANPKAVLAKAFEDAVIISHKKPSVVRRNVQLVRKYDSGITEAQISPEESKRFGETFADGAVGMQRFLDKYRYEEWGGVEEEQVIVNNEAQPSNTSTNAQKAQEEPKKVEQPPPPVQNQPPVVVSCEFKALGIDTIQINAFLNIIQSIDENEAKKALFLTGDVSGGDIKKLYQSLQTTPAQFSEFLEREYLWHEKMRSSFSKPIFYFSNSILGGGGLGVFNSCTYKITNPKTTYIMPEIELGACPDVAGTYDLPRLGAVGRAMAVSALDINGTEAFVFGLADYLVDSEDIPHLKEALLDSIIEKNGENVKEILQEFSVKQPELPRFSLVDYNEIWGENFTIEQVVENIKEKKNVEKSLAARAYEKMRKASSYGIILADLMFQEGKTLDLKTCRALEYEVWTTMEKTDFLESIHSRFILPKAERREPKFIHPNIFDLSPAEIASLKQQLVKFIDSLKPKLNSTKDLLFSSLAK